MPAKQQSCPCVPFLPPVNLGHGSSGDVGIASPLLMPKNLLIGVTHVPLDQVRRRSKRERVGGVGEGNGCLCSMIIKTDPRLLLHRLSS